MPPPPQHAGSGGGAVRCWAHTLRSRRRRAASAAQRSARCTEPAQPGIRARRTLGGGAHDQADVRGQQRDQLIEAAGLHELARLGREVCLRGGACRGLRRHPGGRSAAAPRPGSPPRPRTWPAPSRPCTKEITAVRPSSSPSSARRVDMLLAAAKRRVPVLLVSGAGPRERCSVAACAACCLALLGSRHRELGSAAGSLLGLRGRGLTRAPAQKQQVQQQQADRYCFQLPSVPGPSQPLGARTWANQTSRSLPTASLLLVEPARDSSPRPARPGATRPPRRWSRLTTCSHSTGLPPAVGRRRQGLGRCGFERLQAGRKEGGESASRRQGFASSRPGTRPVQSGGRRLLWRQLRRAAERSMRAQRARVMRGCGLARTPGPVLRAPRTRTRPAASRPGPHASFCPLRESLTQHARAPF